METIMQRKETITIKDKIQNQKSVDEYNYSTYNERFFLFLQKMKCPTCHSKEIAYHFCTDKTIIACQNMKKKKDENGYPINICPSVGRYVFLTYHLLDDRFGQIISKLMPFHYREINELVVMEKSK